MLQLMLRACKITNSATEGLFSFGMFYPRVISKIGSHFYQNPLFKSALRLKRSRSGRRDLAESIRNTLLMREFNVYGSVHRNNILIYIQQNATLPSLFYLEIALHVSGGKSTHHQESYSGK
jgi:hypothetical protein